MVEKKEIKTKKELEMEKAGEKGFQIEETGLTKNEAKPLEKKLEKGRNSAQKMFEDMISTFREKQGDFEKAMSEYTASAGKLSMDVIETDTTVIVIADIPGVKKEDIIIDLTEDSLEVTAKFKEESEFEGKSFIKKERKYGEVKRTVNLPQLFKIDEANAKFDNGVLTVTIPKEEKKRTQLKLE